MKDEENQVQKFKDGFYYQVKKSARWSIIVSSPLGISRDTMFITPDDRLRYYNGYLIINGDYDKRIEINDEWYDRFERAYSKENLEKWAQLRLQYAGQAMQGIINNHHYMMSLITKEQRDFANGYCYDVKSKVAEKAFAYADAMIDILKKESTE